MSLALNLAKKGRYTVSPNPMVGCVIVKNNKIIGQGWHERAGESHAEVIALKEAGSAAKGATVYVTLEPCCHTGRTPPCTQALIKAGIKKIYIATLDPNPLVAGKGMQELKNNGIDITAGLNEDEAIALNEIFFHYIKTKQPYIISKWAMSLDGRMICHPHDSREITHTQTNVYTHEIRHLVDAILIGAKTAAIDNPQLTVRHYDPGCTVKHPKRIILSGKGNLPLDLNIFSKELPGKTLVVTTEQADQKWINDCREKNIDLMVLPNQLRGEINLFDLLNALGKLEITSILVEGGMMTQYNFIKNNLVNKLQVFIAPVIIGPVEKKLKLPDLTMLDHGKDFSFMTTLR